MFNFLKLKKAENDDLKMADQNDKAESDYDSSTIGAVYAATQSAEYSVQQAAQKFAKGTYTGNRMEYDSGPAKLNAKKALFNDGKEVIDPYTGDKLVLTKKEARLLYGEDWQKHLAESDHVKPLEQIYKESRNNPWVTKEDVKDAANSNDNMRVVSKKFNNAKRSRTNKEFVEDENYLKNKGIELTEEGKANAIRDGELADRSVSAQIKKAAKNNLIETGHEAGKSGAKNAGVTTLTMSGIMNLTAVLRGEKSCDEALTDTLIDGGKAAVTGYMTGGGLTVAAQSLSNSSSTFIQGLIKSNVPGKVITAVIVTGDTLARYGRGEISTQECLIELGDKGLNLATMGYSMAVGQALIPIPIVGGAIGALAGSMLTSEYYHRLICDLQVREMEHQERLRIIEECHRASEQTKVFREELERYLDNYFKEYRDCFDGALSSMRFAYQVGDADGIIAGANDITRKLGGQVHYNTVKEFEAFLDDASTDVL